MAASIKVDVCTALTDDLEQLLVSHLPYSLPVLRRLQYFKYQQKHTLPDARVILLYNDQGAQTLTVFTAAHVNFAGGPDNQMWCFSTFESDAAAAGTNELDESARTGLRRHLQTLVREISRLAEEYGKPTYYPNQLLVGSLHSLLRRELLDMKRITPRPTGLHDKWIFQRRDMEGRDTQLPTGLSWDKASLRDCEIAVVRTNLPRTPQALSLLKSAVIRTEDGTPIAWAFIATDGSLISLHVEERYRRQGLAKLLGARLIAEGPGEYASDGLVCADVQITNVGSQGFCRSLNGVPKWEVSWVMLHTTEDGFEGGG